MRPELRLRQRHLEAQPVLTSWCPPRYLRLLASRLGRADRARLVRNDDLDPACTNISLAHRLGRQAGDRGLFFPLMPIVPSVGGSKMASGAKHHPFGLERLPPYRWPTPKILPADKG